MSQIANELLMGGAPEKFRWDKQDFERAIQVQALVQMSGWKVLMAMLSMQREAIIVSKVTTGEQALLKDGKIAGFDLACNQAFKIIQESERQVKSESVRKENEKMLQEV